MILRTFFQFFAFLFPLTLTICVAFAGSGETAQKVGIDTVHLPLGAHVRDGRVFLEKHEGPLPVVPTANAPKEEAGESTLPAESGEEPELTPVTKGDE